MKVPTHTVIIGGQIFNMVHTEDHQEALQAETTRRLEAEKVVDWILKNSDIYWRMSAFQDATQYRAKYQK